MTDSNVRYWWLDDPSPGPGQRDAIVLRWKTWLWLAMRGWLITVPIGPPPNDPPRVDATPQDIRDRWKRKDLVRQALTVCRGVQKDAARMVGVSPRVLSYYIRKYDLYDLCTHPACRPGNRIKQRARVQRALGDVNRADPSV